jgi:hypothetical protein
MKLKPLLFLGAVAGAVAVVKRRGGAEQLAQAAPQPVRDAAQQAAGAAQSAAQSAGATVQRAVQNAPEAVQQAVDKVTPGDGAAGGDSTQVHERYEPPAEGLAQPPTEAGGPPSDQTPVTEASPRTSEATEDLHFPHHDLPEGTVMPDTSADDPLVRQQEKAAAGDAGSIGGSVDELAAEDASYPEDPAMRPVVEGIGDESEETFEAREGTERGNRETEL